MLAFVVGLAAGFDKDAQAMEPLLGLGLGFVEIGDAFAAISTSVPYCDMATVGIALQNITAPLQKRQLSRCRSFAATTAWQLEVP